MRGSFGDKVCDAEETKGSCHARQHGSTWNNELEDERSSVQLKLQPSYCYGIDVPAFVKNLFLCHVLFDCNFLRRHFGWYMWLVVASGLVFFLVRMKNNLLYLLVCGLQAHSPEQEAAPYHWDFRSWSIRQHVIHRVIWFIDHDVWWLIMVLRTMNYTAYKHLPRCFQVTLGYFVVFVCVRTILSEMMR